MVLYRDAFLADYHGNATSETDSRRYRGAPRRHHQTRKLHQGASRYVHGHGDVGGESGKIDRVPFFFFFFFNTSSPEFFTPRLCFFYLFIYLFRFVLTIVNFIILYFYHRLSVFKQITSCLLCLSLSNILLRSLIVKKRNGWKRERKGQILRGA